MQVKTVLSKEKNKMQVERLIGKFENLKVLRSPGERGEGLSMWSNWVCVIVFVAMDTQILIISVVFRMSWKLKGLNESL